MTLSLTRAMRPIFLTLTISLLFQPIACYPSSPQGHTDANRTDSPKTDLIDPQCNVSGTGGHIDFVATLPCRDDESRTHCLATSLKLHLESDAESSGGAQTTSLSIVQGQQALVKSVTQFDGGSTASQVDYGDVFKGVHRVAFTIREGTMTGHVDGREIAPVKIREPTVRGGIEFADHRPVPAVDVASEVRDQVFELLDLARAALPKACMSGVNAGSSESPRDDSALGRAAATLMHPSVNAKKGHAGAAAQSRNGAQTAALHAASDVQPSGSPRPQSLRHRAVPFQNFVPPAPVAVREQNTAFNFSTPDCVACQKDCGKNVISWFVPFAAELCMASCMIPVIGGCNENPCSPTAACDSGNECCATTCCGAGAVCGHTPPKPEDSIDVCCPVDHPVACGDVTAAGCYLPGSSCCGSQRLACNPGDLCVSPVGTPEFCCPSTDVCGNECCDSGQTCQHAPNGGASACCSTTLCGGVCCETGSVCAKGACCLGNVDSKGNCCGLGPVCNGQCCGGGQCTGNGSCCTTGQVCGKSCCPSTQICLNPTTSTCGAPSQPTLLLLQHGSVVSRSGSPPGPNGQSFMPFVNPQNVTLQGLGFQQGPVALTVDTVNGTLIRSLTVDVNGRFAVTLLLQMPEGKHLLVAAQNVKGVPVQATLALRVDVLK